MEGIWKTLAVPMIIGITVGLVVGLILGRIQSPEVPAITAKVQWTDTPNPFYLLDVKSISELDKLAQSILGVAGLKDLIERSRSRSEVRLITVKLRNISNIRSKEIEISATNSGGLYSPQSEGSNKAFSSQLKIKSLDPDGSADVVVIGNKWLPFFPVPLLILHDGKKIDTQVQVLPDELLNFATFFEDYPLLIFSTGMVMVITTLFVLIALPISIFAASNPAFKAKLTTREELAKTVRFVEYMKEHHLERFVPPQPR